jgi:hypothetical protein
VLSPTVLVPTAVQTPLCSVIIRYGQQTSQTSACFYAHHNTGNHISMCTTIQCYNRIPWTSVTELTGNTPLFPYSGKLATQQLRNKKLSQDRPLTLPSQRKKRVIPTRWPPSQENGQGNLRISACLVPELSRFYNTQEPRWPVWPLLPSKLYAHKSPLLLPSDLASLTLTCD